jgi:phage tail sheath protein FI
LPVYHTPGVYFERKDNSPLAVGLPRADITGFVGITMRGPLFNPVKVESWNQFVSTFGDHIAPGYLAYSVYGFFANGGRTAWICRIADPTKASVAGASFGSVRICAGTPGTWGNTIYVEPFVSGSEIVAILVRFRDGSEQLHRPPFRSTPLLKVENLFEIPQKHIDPSLAVPPLVRTFPLELATTLPQPGYLEGGLDGLATLTPQHFLTAFETFVKIPEIAIVAAPDLMPKLNVLPRFKQPPTTCCVQPGVAAPPSPPPPADTDFPPNFTDGQIQDLQLALTAHAESMRYRFAILDGGGERDTATSAILWSKALPRSSFGAVYFPWVCSDDPLRLTGLLRAVPASGHIAGIFSRSDLNKGVHKPPMNEVLEAVTDVRFHVDDTQHGLLNDENVNAIRTMPGRGIRLMGTRTLWTENIYFRYVNVRRLLSTIEKALEQSLSWLVFEPNNPHLWTEIDRLVRNFMEMLFNLGMLEGATSEEAYYVHCDATTNPPSETDVGRVICEIGLQPPYPAEFVVVTIGFTKDGLQVREERERNA